MQQSRIFKETDVSRDIKSIQEINYEKVQKETNVWRLESISFKIK